VTPIENMMIAQRHVIDINAGQQAQPDNCKSYLGGQEWLTILTIPARENHQRLR
jgi:hypothetical protein